MNRRTFLASTAAAGTAVAMSPNLQSANAGERQYYELRRYEFDPAKPEQRETFVQFLQNAAIPALNRLGIKPVGVFEPRDQPDTLYVLLPHASPASAVTLVEELGSDSEFLQAGAEIIDATSDAPPYQRFTSSFFRAFSGMPTLETPVTAPGRILQLRIYESPTEATTLKKIEMFNDAGEIRIFRKVGLHPVFFGQAVIGEKMPNLTYMLAFKDEGELNANWQRFRTDPEWQKLKAMPEYADKAILSGITNILLRPAAGSQI